MPTEGHAWGEAAQLSRASNGGAEAAPSDARTTVTERQRVVVALIARGLSNDEIALCLGISPRTVRAHTDALRMKLRAPHRRVLPAAFYAQTGEDPFAI